MPDWKPHIRSRLASLRLSSSRESEIIEELSQHLEDRWRELTAAVFAAYSLTCAATRPTRWLGYLLGVALVAGGASEDEATKLALAGWPDAIDRLPTASNTTSNRSARARTSLTA